MDPSAAAFVALTRFHNARRGVDIPDYSEAIPNPEQVYRDIDVDIESIILIPDEGAIECFVEEIQGRFGVTASGIDMVSLQLKRKASIAHYRGNIDEFWESFVCFVESFHGKTRDAHYARDGGVSCMCSSCRY